MVINGVYYHSTPINRAEIIINYLLNCKNQSPFAEKRECKTDLIVFLNNKCLIKIHHLKKIIIKVIHLDRTKVDKSYQSTFEVTGMMLVTLFMVIRPNQFKYFGYLLHDYY